MHLKQNNLISISFGGTDEYSKGVTGSFDASFFTEPGTGKFRFPAYTANWKGLVRIKDVTNYRSNFLSGLKKKEQEQFSIDDFEYYFTQPAFVVEKFPDFIQRFPEASFNKGISREQVFFLFNEFRYFLTDQDDMQKEAYSLTHDQVREALALGLLKTVDAPLEPVQYWSRFTHPELQDICTDNGIQPASAKPTTIKRLIENNAPFPYAVVLPTALLKETYWSFIDLYIQDIREQTDHFHPLYFPNLWKEVRAQCGERGAWRRAEKIIHEPYWTDRLFTGTKKYKDDDYE